MVRSLNHTTRGLKEALEEAKRSEDALRELLSRGEPAQEELRTAIDDLRRTLVGLNRIISSIRTSEGA